LWKARPDGVTTFRHLTPLLLWWAWVAFLLLNLYGVAASHPGNIHSARVTALLLLATGVMYACTAHSRVTCDDEGVTIYNPVRDHHAPWGAVEAVQLGNSVEFRCRRPAPKKDKTIYSWALYAQRRPRGRSQAQRSFFAPAARVSSRAPAEAAELARQQPSQLMTAELARRASEAKDNGAADGVLQSQWAWRPVAAITIPAAALLVAMVIS
jgi:hypothetical protein